MTIRGQMRVYAYVDGLTTPRFLELPLALFFIEDGRFPARLLIAFPPQPLICSGSTQVLTALLDMQRSNWYSTQPILRVEVYKASYVATVRTSSEASALPDA